MLILNLTFLFYFMLLSWGKQHKIKHLGTCGLSGLFCLLAEPSNQNPSRPGQNTKNLMGLWCNDKHRYPIFFCWINFNNGIRTGFVQRWVLDTITGAINQLKLRNCNFNCNCNSPKKLRSNFNCNFNCSLKKNKLYYNYIEIFTWQMIKVSIYYKC